MARASSWVRSSILTSPSSAIVARSPTARVVAARPRSVLPKSSAARSSRSFLPHRSAGQTSSKQCSRHLPGLVSCRPEQSSLPKNRCEPGSARVSRRRAWAPASSPGKYWTSKTTRGSKRRCARRFSSSRPFAKKCMTDNVLTIKAPGDTRWDCASLGEVMLRFDPGFGRVRNARSFQVWEGGGEYNVARAMRKCWGKRSTVVRALPVNDLGWLVEDMSMQGGVDLSHVIWREFDGIGRNTRVGLNFTEKGFGIRAALGCSDRGHSAASQIKPGEINWEKLFGEEGVRWFHTGGIFAALASNTAETVVEAVEIARRHGTIVSYDLNYRPSLWKSRGGSEGAQRVNRSIAKYVDVMIGNEEDFTARLGFGIEGLDQHISAMDPANFKQMMQTAVKQFPNLKVAAATLRNARTATYNDWSAILYADGQVYQSILRENLEIYDRVGGGDGFASGLAYAFLEGKGPQAAVEYGAAHGALAMTTPGDTSMVNAQEVEAVMKGKGARTIR